MTRNHADAEDLLQDTVVNAYAGFHPFQAGADTRATLASTLLDQQRQKAALLRTVGDQSRDHLPDKLNCRVARGSHRDHLILIDRPPGPVARNLHCESDDDLVGAPGSTPSRRHR